MTKWHSKVYSTGNGCNEDEILEEALGLWLCVADLGVPKLPRQRARVHPQATRAVRAPLMKLPTSAQPQPAQNLMSVVGVGAGNELDNR